MSAAALSEPPREARGVRVERIPGKGPHIGGDGRVAVPLWLLRHERHLGDTEWKLSLTEAAELIGQLQALLPREVSRGR